MPAVQPPAKVLVTGASGFLAVWLVKSLLARGFSVRGTVRSPPKGEYLKALFEPEFPGKFEYVIVGDIAKPGAFDAAVDGVDAVAHTASPVIFSKPGDPPEDIIAPAVSGTVEILKSTKAHGKSVKRIVVTSSGAALLEPHGDGYQYSERDWNEFSINEVEQKGAHAEGVHKYRASKTLAERALWDFTKDNAGEISFDAVTVNPPFIYGPLLQEISSIDQLNLSSRQLYDAFVTPKPDNDLTGYSGQFIDVRDVAEAHVDALVRGDLAGRRLVIGNGAVAWQDFYDAANSLPPETFAGLPFKIPKGRPGAADAVRASFVAYSPESKELLGHEFRSLPEVVRDTLLSLKERKLI